ncbi:hypothetical protein HpMS204_08320 [Helicobacter pylori]
MHQIIRKILKKMIKKPHLDHTQALSSHVSGSLGTLKVFLVWVRNISLTHSLMLQQKTLTSQGVRRKYENKASPTQTKKPLCSRLNLENL